MIYLIPLALSALSTNGVHAYLLLTHKSNRRWSISEHAVLHEKGFMLYVLGHVLGGGLFLVFAKLYYVDVAHVMWLFYLSLWAVFFEYTQALLPAKGKTNTAHTRTAIVMWASFIVIGALSIIVIDVNLTRQVVSALLYGLLLFNLIKAYRNRPRLYRYQMTMVILFYVAMFVLVA